MKTPLRTIALCVAPLALTGALLGLMLALDLIADGQVVRL